MRQIVVLTAPDRLARTNARLSFLLSNGESDVQPAVLAERLSQKRDPRGQDLRERLELAYLVKLKSALSSGVRNPYVETVIAGKPDEEARRVFARLTNDPAKDGTTLVLYTGARGVEFEGIPVSTEFEFKGRREQNVQMLNEGVEDVG